MEGGGVLCFSPKCETSIEIQGGVHTDSSVIGVLVNSSLGQLIIRLRLSLDFNRYLVLWCTYKGSYPDQST